MGNDWLAERFEGERPRLLAVAQRLLGSESEAEDAVQEAWLRLSRTDAGEIQNLGGWLTTVVSRVCLDALRSRRARPEQELEAHGAAVAGPEEPEGEVLLAESVGMAMQVVLDRLPPAERVAFVLHDVFGVPFEEIAGIVGRTPVAARQLASRARRRVQGQPDSPAGGTAEHRRIVEAFFRASRSGDFAALLEVLDPEVVLRPDAAALQIGARTGWISGELRGATAVAQRFAGQAQAAQVAIIDGAPGGAWVAGGKTRVAFLFTIAGGKVAAIDLVADAGQLERFAIEFEPANGD